MCVIVVACVCVAAAVGILVYKDGVGINNALGAEPPGLWQLEFSMTRSRNMP